MQAAGPGSLLIPLNVCRRDNLYVPWKCENERHVYEEYVVVATLLFDLYNLSIGNRCQYKE